MFDMRMEFPLNSKLHGETCDADALWLSNAYILGDRPTSDKEVDDFDLLRIPVNREGPIREMGCEALFDVLKMTLWCLDGDLYCTAERGPRWQVQMEELIELIEQRAYFLAKHQLTADLHDMPEYIWQDERPSDRPRGGDSDDEGADLVLDGVVHTEALLSTRVNYAFLWDFNSFLSHAKIQLNALRCIQLTPEQKVDLEKVRDEIIAQVQEPSLLQNLLLYRATYEYELECNEADRRYYQRHFPRRKDPAARAILACKGVQFVSSEQHPKLHHPTTLAGMFDRARKRYYRLNCDAALMYLSDQMGDGLIRRIILQGWETEWPQLTEPRIIYIRPLRCWGVVRQWPTVTRYSSLLAAYTALKNEGTMEIEETGRCQALAIKRLKLL